MSSSMNNKIQIQKAQSSPSIEVLANFYEQWKSGAIGDAHMAQVFFLWGQGHKGLGRKSTARVSKALVTGCESLLEVIKTTQFKGVKQKALEALINWQEKAWGCLLFDRMLTPLEVLALQAQGLRPVSMLIRPLLEHPQAPLQKVLHRQDCFDFLIHDLEHAYMFFHDQQKKQDQIFFFQQMQKEIQSGEDHCWNQAIKDQHMKERFDYAISDMNTHLAHYYHYLKALVQERNYQHPQLNSFFSILEARLS